MEEDRKPVEGLEPFEAYFKEDLDAIEEELEKSKKYSEIIDREIQKFTNSSLPSKGGEHYLIEHITNAVQLQTQRQGLRKDRVAIKKLIVDYATKAIDRNKDGSDEANLMDEIKKLISQSTADYSQKSKVSDSDLDSEIDNALEEGDE